MVLQSFISSIEPHAEKSNTDTIDPRNLCNKYYCIIVNILIIVKLSSCGIEPAARCGRLSFGRTRGETAGEPVAKPAIGRFLFFMGSFSENGWIQGPGISE